VPPQAIMATVWCSGVCHHQVAASCEILQAVVQASSTHGLSGPSGNESKRACVQCAEGARDCRTSHRDHRLQPGRPKKSHAQQLQNRAKVRDAIRKQRCLPACKLPADAELFRNPCVDSLGCCPAYCQYVLCRPHLMLTLHSHDTADAKQRDPSDDVSEKVRDLITREPPPQYVRAGVPV
jgi:hypothetical protein